LLITPHGAFVSGVVTGELTTSDGDPIGRDTRPITTAADLRRSEGRTVAVVRAFEVDMIGIPVRVASFTLDPGIAHPGAPARYPRERDTG
jgi:hypothetical protein